MLYCQTKDFFDALAKQLSSLKEKIAVEKDLTELVDTVYALRDTLQLIEHMRSELIKLKQSCEQLSCFIGMAMEEVEVKTDYCSAKLDINLGYKVVKKREQPEKYREFLKELGFPEGLLTDDMPEIFRLHWPGFQEYCRKCAQEGKNVPKNIGEPMNEYTVSIRKRKNIDE